MALKKVIAASQVMRIKALIVYMYGDAGLGKTSLAFTAEDSILFDFDAGAHRAGKLRRGGTVPVEHWLDVANIEASDVEHYKSIIIDTAGRAIDCIKSHLAENKDNRQRDGSLKLKAQGIANELFKNWIARIRSYGKDVIILAHAAEDKKGEDIIIRPDVGGKNRNELYRQADIMGYLTNTGGEKGGSIRMLNFRPSPSYHAKNSGGLGDVELPDLADNPRFLAGLLQQSKDHINSLTDAQVKELQALDDLENWKNECELCEDAQDLNDMLAKMDREHRFIKEMRQAFSSKVKTMQVDFDQAVGKYLDKNAPSKTPDPITDPVAESNPEPVEPKTVEPVKVNMIELLKKVTNAINLTTLKEVVDGIDKSILSDKEKESLNRAYTKRKSELQPLTTEQIEQIITIMEMATTKEQLDKTWVEKVDSFSGVITEAQSEHLNRVYSKCLDEIACQAA